VKKQEKNHFTLLTTISKRTTQKLTLI
jgi:hypothetical protein